MMRYFEPEHIKEADILAVGKYGLTSLELMKNAGSNAAREILKRYPDALCFTILAGPGNNGGDGFVAAKSLLLKGLRVTVILSSEINAYSGDAKISLDSLITLKESNCTIKLSINLSDRELREISANADCMIDSLLGTGSRGAPRGEVERMIRECKNNRAVVALDIPSGIDPLTGNIYDLCIKADLTVTFLAPKRGMCFSPAYEMCGTVVTADIGITPDKVLDGRESILSFVRDDISDLLPSLQRHIHKGDRGGVLILGGSINYRGAPLLAGLGALRSGAGLVVLAIPDFMADSVSLILPEAIIVPLKTNNGEILPQSAAEAAVSWEKRCGVSVVGPGLGRGSSSGSILEWFWNKWKKPLLVDGDGLYFLSGSNFTPEFRENAVLTPHSGEAAALLGITHEKVGTDRIGTALTLTRTAGTVLLKGMDTVICSKGKDTTIIKGGSPSLAIPGSGDVLSGSAGALMASGMPIWDAVRVGAAAHAAAGALLEAKYGIRGALAREIADALPFTLI